MEINLKFKSTEAELLIDLSMSTITTKPEIQTSKKQLINTTFKTNYEITLTN